MRGYRNSLEHVLDALQRIDLLIHRHVLQFRLIHQRLPDEWRGLYLSDDDIATLVQKIPPHHETSPEVLAHLTALDTRLVELEAHIAMHKAASRRAGIVLRLERLQTLFRLTALDLDTLLLCLAPEFEAKYPKLYASLQDDVTRKYPTMRLALALLCPAVEARLAARAHFAPTAPLRAANLLQVCEASERQTPFLDRALQVDERLVDYVFDADGIEARLLSLVHWGHSQVPWQDIVLPEDVKTRLEQLLQWYGTASHPPSLPPRCTLYLQGPPGVGKQTTAAALCDALGMPLLVVDVERCLHTALPWNTLAPLLVREALLQQAVLYFEHFDVLRSNAASIASYRHALLDSLRDLCGLTFLAGQSPWHPGELFPDHIGIQVPFTAPTYALRQQLWQACLPDNTPVAIDPGALASKFRLGAGQICGAVATAQYLALWRQPGCTDLTADDLEFGCRAHSRRMLSTLAHQVPCRSTWHDLVLPKEQMTQLREIVSVAKHRQRVYGEWGFEQKLSLGKGLYVLVSGPSGTGKTMAAAIIAGELRLDLYKIDLSTIVSKYIGETEKNLDRLFLEAQDVNVILFFDEANALFGKRSEVKDAHDRYANLEIAYLLQKMEGYEGMVILATNLRKNMDEAFARRMHAALEFPFPEEAERQRLWHGVFPAQTPLGADVDLGFVAQHFKLSGGNITNVALHAAFLAAEEHGAIRMAHLIHATKREYQKLGRLCNKADFGPFYALVHEAE